MSIISNKEEIVSPAGLEVSTVFGHVTIEDAIKTNTLYMGRYLRMCNRMGMGHEQMRTLMIMVNSWINDKRGLTKTQVQKLSIEFGDNTYSILRGRMDRLLRMGLIEIIGHTRPNTFIYAPTPKAIDVVGKIMIVEYSLDEAC